MSKQDSNASTIVLWFAAVAMLGIGFSIEQCTRKHKLPSDVKSAKGPEWPIPAHQK